MEAALDTSNGREELTKNERPKKSDLGDPGRFKSNTLYTLQ